MRNVVANVAEGTSATPRFGKILKIAFDDRRLSRGGEMLCARLTPRLVHCGELPSISENLRVAGRPHSTQGQSASGFLSAPVCARDREDRLDHVRYVTIRQPRVERQT